VIAGRIFSQTPPNPQRARRNKVITLAIIGICLVIIIVIIVLIVAA
jgi:hypothetical protein